MIKFLKKLLLISVILLFLGSVFMFMQWPGASLMFIQGATLLCFVAFFEGTLRIANKRPFAFLYFLIALSAVVGMFKIQSWPAFAYYKGFDIFGVIVAATTLVFCLRPLQIVKWKFYLLLICALRHLALQLTPSSQVYKYRIIRNMGYNMPPLFAKKRFLDYAFLLAREERFEEARVALNFVKSDLDEVNDSYSFEYGHYQNKDIFIEKINELEAMLKQ